MVLHLTQSSLKAKALDFVQKWGKPLLSKRAAGEVSSQRLRRGQGQGQGQGQGATESQTLAFFLQLVSRLLCYASASYFTENKAC